MTHDQLSADERPVRKVIIRRVGNLERGPVEFSVARQYRLPAGVVARPYTRTVQAVSANARPPVDFWFEVLDGAGHQIYRGTMPDPIGLTIEIPQEPKGEHGSFETMVSRQERSAFALTFPDSERAARIRFRSALYAQLAEKDQLRRASSDDGSGIVELSLGEVGISVPQSAAEPIQ